MPAHTGITVVLFRNYLSRFELQNSSLTVEKLVELQTARKIPAGKDLLVVLRRGISSP